MGARKSRPESDSGDSGSNHVDRSTDNGIHVDSVLDKEKERPTKRLIFTAVTSTSIIVIAGLITFWWLWQRPPREVKIPTPGPTITETVLLEPSPAPTVTVNPSNPGVRTIVIRQPGERTTVIVISPSPYPSPYPSPCDPTPVIGDCP